MPKKTKSFVGLNAPAFALKDEEGRLVRLTHFKGKKVILYFYVRDDTPGCTKEACSFRDGTENLQVKNTVVLGVSSDSVESHKRFKEKYHLNFPLLVDENAKLAKKLGVWGKKNMYGRTFHGIIRSTFIIDEAGRIVKDYRHVKVNGHLKRVISAL